jgi:putative addiction module component (TIGR02574 family)
LDTLAEEKMTHQELIAAIESLPKDVQFALANSVLDRLANEGPPPISEELKAEFLRREESFFARPDQGESWENVRAEVFGQ